MTTPITPGALVDSVYSVLNAMAPAVKTANDLRGGGGYENWTLVQFLLAVTGGNDLDYRREAPYAGKRVDIAFNENNISVNTPLSWTEWKCNPNTNQLSMECQKDIQKFIGMLQEYPVNNVLPLPLIIGVGPQKADFPGVAGYPISDRNEIYLSLSTAVTWNSYGVLDKTWYGQGAAEGAVPSLLPTAVERAGLAAQ